MKIITYRLATEINRSTPEEPDIEISLADVSMPYTEANYQLALSEAYNGEITIEDDGQPEPEPAPEYVTYEELAAAIREGVNSVEQR